MGSVNSSEGPWLQRFANEKPVRKPKRQQPWKAAPDQSRDIVASVQCILDRENFVRGYVFLDDYDPSEYDPFFRRRAQTAGRCEEIWSPTLTSRKLIERVTDVLLGGCSRGAHSNFTNSLLLRLRVFEHAFHQEYSLDLY